MGSGLILLVIVAAWLAVLVPMALRSHETGASTSSVERFSEAMRVLSRRSAARSDDEDPLSAEAWADNDSWDGWDADDEQLPRWRERLSGWASAATGPLRRSGERRPSSPVVRRRRLLLTLIALTLLSAVGGAAGPRALLVVAGVLAVAVALFVVQLRRLAVARAARARRPVPAREAPAARPAARSVVVRPVDVPQPVEVPEPVEVEPAAAVAEPAAAEPAVWHEEPVAVPAPAAALGRTWSPVPVPSPTYLTAPVAPSRRPRSVDLTRPGAWSARQVSRPAEELPDGGRPVEPAAERRRAVNEW